MNRTIFLKWRRTNIKCILGIYGANETWGNTKWVRSKLRKRGNDLNWIIHNEVDRYNNEEVRGLGYSLN